MTTKEPDYVRDEPRSFSSIVKELTLAMAGQKNSQARDRVSGGGDSPERGYSLHGCMKRFAHWLKCAKPKLGGYLASCKKEITAACCWVGCQVTRFWLWVLRISGSLDTRRTQVVDAKVARQNDENDDDTDGNNSIFSDEESKENEYAIEGGPMEWNANMVLNYSWGSTARGFAQRRVINENGDQLTELTNEQRMVRPGEPFHIDQLQPLSPLLTPQTSFDSHIEERWYDERYVPGSFDPSSYKTQFYFGDGFYITHWSEVTLEVRMSRMNPFGEEFVLLCLLGVDLAHLVEHEEYEHWFKSQFAGELIAAIQPFVYDKMPSEVDDVSRWLSIAMMLATGVPKKERDQLALSTGMADLSQLSCATHGLDCIECTSECTQYNGPIDDAFTEETQCWKLLFDDFDSWNDGREEPRALSKSQLLDLIEEGAPLSSGNFSIQKRNDIFHVSRGGTLDAKSVVSSLPNWWSRLGFTRLNAWQPDEFGDPEQEMPRNSIDRLVIEILNFYVFVMLNVKTVVEMLKECCKNLVWTRRAITVSIVIMRLYYTIAKPVIKFTVKRSVNLIGIIDTTFTSRMAQRFKILMAVNCINILISTTQFWLKMKPAEWLSIGIVLTLLACMFVPVLLTTILILTSVSVGVIFWLSFTRKGMLTNIVSWLLTLVRTLTIALVDGPLKPVAQFVVNARMTMWIITERPQRYQVLTRFWVLDRLIEVDDRYSASQDTQELALSLIALCWGSWTIAIVGTALCYLTLVGVVLALKSMLTIPLKGVHLFYRILSFMLISSMVIFGSPNVSVDTLMYTLLYIKLVIKAGIHDLGPTIYTLFHNLKERLDLVIQHNPYWTPSSINGLPTHMTLPEVKFALFRVKTIGVLRHSIVRFVVAFENIDLPKLVSTQYTKPSKETLQESLELLKELGWPVNVWIDDNDKPKTSVFKDFEGWFLANTSFIQPLRNIKTVFTEEMRMFDIFNPPKFKHTGEYTSERLEVESTARYFKNNVTEGDIDVEDEVWELLHEHFEDSVLAKTARVVNKLIKKYSVGFGFMNIEKGRTMTRKALLTLVQGEKGLVQLFDRTLAHIGKIVPVAHVFTKFETLKESKWMNNMVRTIIGVPLAHYSNTSKFSYMQNLRHPFERSPIKVGMPLTGAWFADIWEDHSKRKHHFNGDLKMADSSYSRDIFNVIRACRKRGFKDHKDFDAICTMIDIAYDQLMTMPLAFKSTGVVTFKGDGGATGQGNTSVDNSVALVTLYMAAWKRITGKSVKEFNLYNTLSNQADDHILSWDDNNFGWNPKAWMEEFSKMGVTLTDESSSDLLEDATFLAKRIVKDHQTEENKLKKLGIAVPRFLTCHDKNRLLGKIAAPQPLKDRKAAAKRLHSYMFLTAHHKDVYIVIRNAIRVLQAKTKNDLGVKIPPYSAILRSWYTKNPLKHNPSDVGYAAEETMNELTEALDEFGEQRDVLHVSEPRSIEVVLICLSILPQIFSPRFMTSPALRHIHKILGEKVAWPIEMLRRRNGQLHTPGAIATALMKTNYDFINGVDMEGIGSRRSDMSLMLSHWLFTLMQWAFIGGNGPQGLNRLLRSVDSLLANFYFIAFGQTVDVVEAVGFGYLDTMLLVICDLVPDVLPNTKLPYISQIIPSDYLTRWLTRAWRAVQPSAAIDFEAIELLMNKPSFFGSKVIIKAPTGVGKSTRMVSKIASLSHKRRIIVIEPRHILVTGLCDYMNKIDPHTGYGASTTGRTPSTFDRVIYCTYQSMVLCGYGKDTDIVIVDEAHIKDPIYKFAVKDMLSRNCTVLLVTATPDPEWQHTELQYVEISTAPLWRVVENEVNVSSIQAYRDQVIRMTRSLGPLDKALIFMPTTRQCADLLRQLPGHGCIISSKHPEIDYSAQFYVSTRVSDAGLTLPDVAFVFTMDIEWGVSSIVDPDNLFSPEQKLGHYRLDDLTILQRRGRTGRTCDGTFFLFTVNGEYSERKTTAKDLLDELSQLLDLPHIENKLSPEASDLWDKYKEMSIMLGGGDITPQSLLPDAAHYKNPSRYRRANTQISAIHGQNGTNPVVSFDPLRAKNILPGVKFGQRGSETKVDDDYEEHMRALQFWNLLPPSTDENDTKRAKDLQVIPDKGEIPEDFVYMAPYHSDLPYEDSSDDEYHSAEETV